MDWIRRKKSHRRQAKKAIEKRRREKVQKKRLISLGIAPEKAAKMNAKEVRGALRRPKKIIGSQASKTSVP